MKCKHYAIYARQSIDKADSISIETQVERCLLEVGNAPYEVYADRGYSGKNTDRPQFQQMLQAVKSGEICCVICYKLDRCSRSILDFTQLMNLFQQNQVEFISCTEKFDTATPMGRAMLNICIVFAQLERETIQQRITDAYHSRCKKGYFMGGRVPFGFSLVPCVLDGKRTSCYQTVKEEAEILKIIYSLYQEPTASLSDVVLGLNRLKISNPRRSDGIWVRSHIGRMMKNPIYVMADEQIYHYYLGLRMIPDNPREDYTGVNGCYLYNIGKEQHLVLAPHEGIIPSDVWLRCQKHRVTSNLPRNNEIPKSWLNGMIKCQKCGRAAAIRQTTGRNGQIYRYFLCPDSRGKGHICQGFKPFSQHKTEDAIGRAIMDHGRALFGGPEVSVVTGDAASIVHNLLSNIDNQCQLPQKELRESLLQLRATLQNRIITDSEDSQIKQDNRKKVLDRLSAWDNIPAEKKRRIARLLIESVILAEKQVTILWRY